jgi:cyanophycinase-like exopeptidase
VDTHFSERDRLGRLITFAARAAHDGEAVTGLGIDEATAVVIDDDSVQVSGAGDAWLVSLDGDAPLSDGSPLGAAAYVAPLSAQSAWPPVAGVQAPGAQRYVVTDGGLPELD